MKAKYEPKGEAISETNLLIFGPVAKTVSICILACMEWLANQQAFPPTHPRRGAGSRETMYKTDIFTLNPNKYYSLFPILYPYYNLAGQYGAAVQGGGSNSDL
jgi:hypothetical protein